MTMSTNQERLQSIKQRPGKDRTLSGQKRINQKWLNFRKVYFINFNSLNKMWMTLTHRFSRRKTI